MYVEWIDWLDVMDWLDPEQKKLVSAGIHFVYQRAIVGSVEKLSSFCWVPNLNLHFPRASSMVVVDRLVGSGKYTLLEMASVDFVFFVENMLMKCYYCKTCSLEGSIIRFVC